MDPRAGGLLRPEVAAGDSTANTDGNQKQAFFAPILPPKRHVLFSKMQSAVNQPTKTQIT